MHLTTKKTGVLSTNRIISTVNLYNWRFIIPLNEKNRSQLEAGLSFAEGGVTDEDLLESYGAPDKWPQAVTTACDAFEASFGPQDSAKGQSVAMNAELYAKTNEMNALKSTIRHLVKNYCSGNTGARAAWTTAAHVQKPPSTPPPTP